MLMADLAVCVASGKTWLPPMSPEDDGVQKRTLQVPVLLCDFDNNDRMTHDRIAALARARELEADRPLHYVTMPEPWLAANSEVHIKGLAELVKDLGAKLVIIDNLRDVSGGVAENKAEMGDVMANLRKVTKRAETAIVVIHHQRKDKGRDVRSGDALRGHSSIEAAIDLALRVDREGQAKLIKLHPTKVRGANVEPFAAVFGHEHKDGTEELRRAWFTGRAIENTTKAAKVRRKIVEVVRNTPGLNKGEVRSAVKQALDGAGVNYIGNRIDDLAREGKLNCDPGKGREKLYTIADDKT
jgi:hypothetical protein